LDCFVPRKDEFMITLEILKDLRKMLEGWGIDVEDWYVTGEAAMLLSDYPVDFREGQMDVLVCRSSWPWPRPEEHVSLFPNEGTKEDSELKAFIEKHDIMPDFHPLPHVGLEAEDRFEHAYWYPDEKGVRVLSPWAGILHRKIIIEFYEDSPTLNLEVFDQEKFIRWKGFVESVEYRAKELDDVQTVETCEFVLPAIERAIEYFESDSIEDTSSETLKGTSAYEGVVRGEVKLWEDGGDFSGKIAVLTHSLPKQVTLLREALGIVTDQGGTLSHAATIAREYKIPTVIGTKRATQILKDGDVVELDAEAGIVRKIDVI